LRKPVNLGVIAAVALGGVIAIVLGISIYNAPSAPPAPAPTSAPIAPVATTTPAPTTATIPQHAADPCLLPGPPPALPDGGAATADDMHAAHEAIQNFVLQLENYQACRLQQADNAPASVNAEQKVAWIHQGNLAVDEANALADAYSEQMKIFKSHHSDN
jgi:hypothetical protein